MSFTLSEINIVRDEVDKLGKKIPYPSLKISFDQIIKAYEKIIEELMVETNYTG